MLIVLIILIVILFFYVMIERNKIIELDNKADEAFSTMDIYLKKRWDLVPNLVNNVKGYATHEKSVLENVTSLRNNNNYNGLKQNEKIDTNLELERGLQEIIAVVENYPTLKADGNFLQLNKDLNKVEEDIANSRKYYNGVIRMYNNKVEMFPSNIVANMFKFKSRRMFEAKEDERKNVKIDL